MEQKLYTQKELNDFVEVEVAEQLWQKCKNEESFPVEIAEKIAMGQNPIKIFRKWRGIKIISRKN